MGFNQVTLMGNLTRDPQRFGERTTCAEFTLACNETRYDADGHRIEEVYWAGCKAFGRTAETILQHCRKGSGLLVTGKLSNDEWTDRESGKKQSRTRILVRGFQFTGAKRGGDDAPEPSGDGGGDKPSAEYYRQVSANPVGCPDKGDDNVPF